MLRQSSKSLPSLKTPRLLQNLKADFNKQALIDGPASDPKKAVPRHAEAFANLILTPIVIEKLPRAAGRGAVARAWEKQEVEKKWAASSWAKRRESREKRRALTDFERFKVLRLKKQVRLYLINSGMLA